MKAASSTVNMEDMAATQLVTGDTVLAVKGDLKVAICSEIHESCIQMMNLVLKMMHFEGSPC